MTYVAHWWSMDGARLAYLTINNSATPVMEIPHFLGGLYPSNVNFPYPKVKAIDTTSIFLPFSTSIASKSEKAFNISYYLI